MTSLLVAECSVCAACVGVLSASIEAAGWNLSGAVTENPTVGLAFAPVALCAIFGSFRNARNAWFFAFCAATLLLPPLPLPLGNTGPHPAVLFALVGVWVGLSGRSAWNLRVEAISVTAAFFWLSLLLSAGFALIYSGPAVAAGSLARVFLLGIGFYSLFYFAYGPVDPPAQSWRWARWLYGVGAVSALYACIDFYFQLPAPAGFAEQFVRMGEGSYRRAQGVFYDAGMLGNLCAFFLVMMAIAWLRPELERRLISRIPLLAGGMVFSAALLFSFSRSALLNLSAGLFTLLIIDAARIRFRRLIVPALTMIIGGPLATYLLFPAFVESYLLRLWYTVTELHATPQTLLAGRLESWETMLAFVASHPWHAVFGVGFKTLPYSDFIGRTVIADNMYLSLLLEAGVVGLLAMVVFLGALLRASYRAARSPNEQVSFWGTWSFCFWIGQLFQMLSADLMTYWRVLPLYFAAFGLAIRASGEPRPRAPTNE